MLTIRALRPHITWAVPLAAAAWITTWQAARPDPWRDELATWSAATRSVPQIFELGRHIDGVLVPYYLFMHAWIGWFGDSVVAMRMPSLLAMAAAAPLVALLARRHWGNTAGLLGGLLFATLPVISRYGQEIRGYALSVFFGTLATFLLAGALERSRWWRWLPYAVTVTLMGLSHLISLLLLAGHLVMVVAANWRRLIWWVPAAAVAAGVVLPLTVRGLGQSEKQLGWLVPASPDDLAAIAGNVFGAPLIGGIVCGFAVAALRRPRSWPLWVATVLAAGLLYTVDQVITPIFVGRYLLFVVPLLCALAGAGLAQLKRPIAVVVLLVVALIGLPLQLAFRRDHSGFDYRAAAEVLTDNARPGDGVIYAPRDGWQLVDTGIAYYNRDRVPRDLLLTADERATGSLWATECADPVACVGDTHRVWVVAADNLDPPFKASATNQLDYRRQQALRPYAQLAGWRVGGFTVTLFVRPPWI